METLVQEKTKTHHLDLEPRVAQPIAVRPDAAATQETLAGPMAAALQAYRLGMTPADVKSMLEVQKEWEANEARKAFVADMAQFKKNPPEILKDKHVEFRTSKGVTSYDHATIGNVCDKIIKAAAQHGFSHRWIPDVGPHGQLVISCEITHRLGHVQLTELRGPRDDSGNKNMLQGDQSTRTYLERHSLLMAFGFATIDQPDDDGRASTGGTDDVVDGWIKYVNSATSAEQLEQIRKEGAKAFNEAGDIAGWNKVKASVMDMAASLNKGGAK